MADYPAGYDSGREMQNIPGKSYKPEQKTNIFAEDFDNLWAAISAIQHTLGLNPQGDYSTVADRLNATPPETVAAIVTETGAELVTETGAVLVYE